MTKKVNTITKQPRTIKKQSFSEKPLIISDRKGQFVEEYIDCLTLEPKILLTTSIEALAHDVVQWAKDTPDAFKMAQFYLHRGISKNKWDNWVRLHPQLKEAATTAKEFIGVRRETMGLRKELDNTVNLRMLPFYDPDFKEATQWHEFIKAREEAQNNKTVIVLSDLEYKKSEQENKIDTESVS